MLMIDIVLLDPSWRAMQTLLSVAETAASQIYIYMTFTTKKIVVIVFSPCKRSLRIAFVFPYIVLAGCTLLAFVVHFRTHYREFAVR